MDAALAVGEHEEVAAQVPGDLVDLEAKLLLAHDLARPGVDERHHVLLVAHGDGAAVVRPVDVDVLALRGDARHALARARVPDATLRGHEGK